MFLPLSNSFSRMDFIYENGNPIAVVEVSDSQLSYHPKRHGKRPGPHDTSYIQNAKHRREKAMKSGHTLCKKVSDRIDVTTFIMEVGIYICSIRLK